jgi:ABC-type transport system involved in multi-copper enzyme maturation permease subunit
MSNKVARRCMDGTYDFLNLLVGVMVLVPFLIVIPIICLVGAILSLGRTSSSLIKLLGQKIAGTVMSLPENESRRRLTSKEEQIPHYECRQILTS